MSGFTGRSLPPTRSGSLSQSTTSRADDKKPKGNLIRVPGVGISPIVQIPTRTRHSDRPNNSISSPYFNSTTTNRSSKSSFSKRTLSISPASASHSSDRTPSDRITEQLAVRFKESQFSSPGHTTSTSRGYFVSADPHANLDPRISRKTIIHDLSNDQAISPFIQPSLSFEHKNKRLQQESKQQNFDSVILIESTDAPSLDSPKYASNIDKRQRSESSSPSRNERPKTAHGRSTAISSSGCVTGSSLMATKGNIVASLKPRPSIREDLGVSVIKDQIFKNGIRETKRPNVFLSIDINEQCIRLKSNSSVFITISKKNIENFEWGISESHLFLLLNGRVMANNNSILFHFEISGTCLDFRQFIDSIRNSFFETFNEMAPCDLQITQSLLLNGRSESSVSPIPKSHKEHGAEKAKLSPIIPITVYERPQLQVKRALSIEPLESVVQDHQKSTSSLNPVMIDNDTESEDETKAVRRSNRSSKVYVSEEGVELFVYPFDEHFTVSIKDTDHERLNEGVFLNDSIIEFYLKYLQQDSNSGLDPKNVHIFSTFFYQTLTRNTSKCCPTKDSYLESGYNRVKSWTTKVNIFEKKFLVIPINEDLHWYLAIVYNPGALLYPPHIPSTSQHSSIQQSPPHKSSRSIRMPSLRSRHSFSPSGRPPLVLRGASQIPKVISQPDFFDITPKSGTPSKTSLHSVQPSYISADTNKESQEIINLDDPPHKPLVNNDVCHPMELDDTLEAPISTPSSTFPKKHVLQPSATAVSKTSLPSSIAEPEPVEHLSPKISAAMLADFAESEIKANTIDAGSVSREFSDMSTPVVSPSPLGVLSDDSASAPFITDSECHVIVMNSLGRTQPNTIASIKRYLVLEAKSRQNIDVQRDMIHGLNARVPEQPNYCDCGVYVLEYVERFFQEPDHMLNLILSKSAEGREATQNWFKARDIRRKRVAIRQLIQVLAEDYAKLDLATKRKESMAAQRSSTASARYSNGLTTGGIDDDDDDDVLIMDGPPSAINGQS
ncbi:hypothetical protein BASA83_012717 [Batrachochytrium salamandrivorans]|nr:hypothetical protein BASA83_012717 [Batrachochytrium salamandrivorans]